MINVTAKPFRMIASGNCEKLNQELIACFVIDQLANLYSVILR